MGAGMKARQNTAANYNLAKLNVLVVDDNKHMLTVVKTILTALGVRNVRTVVDAADAFKEMRTLPADIVITDWMMSPVDGLDFVRLLRNAKDTPNPYVPIIMLTGHTEMHRVLEARDAGVTEFLAKPISAHALYGRIVTIVEHPRPFVRTKIYFGPCRRRHQKDAYKGTMRRSDDEIAAALTEDDIDRILNPAPAAGEPAKG